MRRERRKSIARSIRRYGGGGEERARLGNLQVCGADKVWS